MLNRWNFLKTGFYEGINEAYTGTAVWGRTSKGEKAQDPVRVERAWPARVGSKFLLSGLLKCGVCGRP